MIEEDVRRRVEDGGGLKMGEALGMLERVDSLRTKVEAQAKAIQSALEHLDEYMEGQQNSPHKVQEVLLAALWGGGKL